MDATCGMFGRSPDFMNIFFTGFASAADEFGKTDKRFAENVRTYHAHIREHDICLTHTLVNPQVDRSRPVEKQDKDLAAKIVKETDAGIVVRGARMVSTLCAYADDLLVLPSTYLANSKEAEPYAFGFSVPVNAVGLRFICRPSVVHQNAASVMDFPLSARFDETDAMVIFDDVLVPWERVFIHRDPELCNGLYNRTGIMPQIMHQFATKYLAKAEFMMGLGFAIAKSTNIDQHLHVLGMLSELIQFTEFSRACLRASEGDAAPPLRGGDPGGNAAVDHPDDVSENVREDVRDHPAPRCRRPCRRALLCRACRICGEGCCYVFPGSKRGCRDADQTFPIGLRRCGIILLGPATAL
ncbi:MAG: hypothetical protein JOY83_15525 [Alphaproteobacteria bacterium]|nr:hypothetical protein [Alphaproteobacteria bacterium]